MYQYLYFFCKLPCCIKLSLRSNSSKYVCIASFVLLLNKLSCNFRSTKLAINQYYVYYAYLVIFFKF